MTTVMTELGLLPSFNCPSPFITPLGPQTSFDIQNACGGAITHALLTKGQGSGTPIVTASVTPTQPFVLIHISTVHLGTAAITTPTVSGCGLVWSLVDSFDSLNSGSTFRMAQFVFKGVGSPSSGTITMNFGGQSQFDTAWIVSEHANVASVVQTKHNRKTSGANISVVLDTAPTGPCIGSVGWNSGAHATAGSGFTLITEQFNSDQNCAAEHNSAQTIDFTVSSVAPGVIVGLELSASGPPANHLFVTQGRAA